MRKHDMSSIISFFSPRSAEEEAKEECKVVNWQQLAKIFYSIDDVCEYYFFMKEKRRKTCCGKERGRDTKVVAHFSYLIFYIFKMFIK